MTLPLAFWSSFGTPPSWQSIILLIVKQQSLQRLLPSFSFSYELGPAGHHYGYALGDLTPEDSDAHFCWKKPPYVIILPHLTYLHWHYAG